MTDAKIIPIRGKRLTTAQRLAANWQQIPHVTLHASAEVTELVRYKRSKQQEWQTAGVHVSYNDLISQAVILGLVAHPLLNATFDGQVLSCWPEVNLGVAMAVSDGLVVPVLRKADHLPLLDLARGRIEMQQKALKGSLTLDDLSGGTFTVTNLGPYGVSFFNPIINAPQVAILGVGQIEEDSTWQNNSEAKRYKIMLSLSFDHRALDGVPAAQFLQTVVKRMSMPSSMETSDGPIDC